MLNQLNIVIFECINAFAGRSSVLDQVARITAEYLPLIFAVWLVILWLKKEKIYKNIALLAGYSMLTDLSLNFMVTIFYFHPRPFMEDMGILLVQHAAETSFPSDHATLMLSIASTLVFFEQSCMQGIILFVLGLLGGLQGSSADSISRWTSSGRSSSLPCLRSASSASGHICLA